MPKADAVVGLVRMNAVLETDLADRLIRVQAGRTNLPVSGAVGDAGFFYAPDPSSQLACAISGHIGMNSGKGALPKIRGYDEQPAGRYRGRTG